METIKNHLPNAITSLNLLCGCLSITFAAKGQIDLAGYAIFAAAVFDFFDGFAARLLKAHSDIGLQLDSLADVVSFGVAPAMMLFYSISNPLPQQFLGAIVHYSPFLIVVFSALRLAKFNIDTRQTESFIGMPTPACALLIASYLIHYTATAPLQLNAYVVLVASVLLSALLVSEIPMFSLKVKRQVSWSVFLQKYFNQIFLIVISLLFIVFYHFGGIAFGILYYLLISIVLWGIGKLRVRND